MKLEKLVEWCLSKDANKQVKFHSLNMVGKCGYDMEMPCKYQRKYEVDLKLFPCVYTKYCNQGSYY